MSPCYTLMHLYHSPRFVIRFRVRNVFQDGTVECLEYPRMDDVGDLLADAMHVVGNFSREQVSIRAIVVIIIRNRRVH
jgi:hypothetical protein